MGLETVWQIMLWVGFTFGVPISIANVMPENTVDYYKKHFKGKNRLFPISIPWIAMVIIWMVVLACAATGAFLIWDMGNWTVNPIELLVYCVTIFASVFWIPVFYGPCKERCTFVATALFIALVLAIATAILFLQIYFLSAILILPLIVWLAVTWWIVWTTEAACQSRYFPVLNVCEQSWVDTEN